MQDNLRRGSGSILQKKEHHDFLRFSWENYYNELQSSCPLLLSTVSAIVCDIPPAIPSKHFMHIMITAAIGLRSRSQELSVVQYLIGMVLTHGGCTQKVVHIRHFCASFRFPSWNLNEFILSHVVLPENFKHFYCFLITYRYIIFFLLNA